MRRTTRLAVLAAVAGLIVPVGASQAPAGAIDQDLVVSAASGAARSEITVFSASCATSDDSESFRFLWVRLVSGTAPAQVLAGIGIGVDVEPAAFVVPDWVDPDEPAVIEATCRSIEFSFEDDEMEPTITDEPYDPVPFDVLASAEAPVQQRAYSRTSLLAGQAFSVEASGCFLDDAELAFVDVVAGSDLSFASVDGVGVSGEGEMDGDRFEAFTALSNGGVSIAAGSDGEVAIEEVATDLPAGSYSTVSYCASEDGATLLFEPELIEITGNAAFDGIDLTVAPGSRTATLAGGPCTAGDVDASLWGMDTANIDDRSERDRAPASGDPVGPSGLVIDRSAADRSFLPATAPSRASSPERVIGEEPVDVVVSPAADGSWSVTDDAGFDRGLVGAFAACGDPLAEGFFYDSQAAVVDATVDTTTTTVPVTTPAPAPAPAPASAVPGTPTYAG